MPALFLLIRTADTTKHIAMTGNGFAGRTLGDGSPALFNVNGPAETASTIGDEEKRLAEYQRNAAFVGFMMLVCGGSLVYLTKNLSEVFVPLIWAAFTAMPLNALISTLDPAIVACFTSIRKLAKCKKACSNHDEENATSFNFSYTGEGLVRIPEKDAALLLKRLRQTRRDELTQSSFSCFSDAWCCCRRRVVIKKLLSGDSGNPPYSEDHRKVNRLVQGWAYYVQEAKNQSCSEERCFEFFVDRHERYPAILEKKETATLEDDKLPVIRGELQVDSTHAVSYFVAGVVALSFVTGCIALFVWLIAKGTQALTHNVDAYVTGSKQFVDKISEFAANVLPKSMIRGMDTKARDTLSDKLPEMASSFLTTAEGLGFEVFLYLLYVLFWTLEPLPVNSEVSGVFKSYLLQKSIVCLIFATLVSILLLLLECPLWHVLFLAAFILNYIPEVGPIACFVLMLPMILLDGNQSFSARSSNALIFVIVFLVIKFVTGNIIEVQLYAKSGGDLMRMHPVVMLALMMLFEALLGITGMFMTVPVMAAVKYYMLNRHLPDPVLDPLLTVIEGSEHGPHMNYVDRNRNTEALLEPASNSDSDKDDATSSDGDDDDESRLMTASSASLLGV